MTQDDVDDVSRWLDGLARGDEEAIRRIFERYFNQLVHVARKKLGDSSRRGSDEEDVAISAFQSLCQGAAAGRFPRLDDRHDLWKVMVTITARKAAAHLRRGHRQKRGRGDVRGESVFERAPSSERGPGIDRIQGKDPTPEVAAMVSEQCGHLLDQLQDESLKTIALRKLEGYSNDEIAVMLDCAPRTVERKLARIRQTWEAEAPPPEEP